MRVPASLPLRRCSRSWARSCLASLSRRIGPSSLGPWIQIRPERFIFDIARSLLAGCRRIAIVGDNLAADINGGKRAGLTTILVLTGTSLRDEVRDAEVSPDIVLPDLAALIDATLPGKR